MKTTNEVKHTPTPWEVHQGQDYIHVYGGNYDDSEHPIAESRSGLANAEFIVRACNSHEALLERVKDALAFVTGSNNFRDKCESRLEEYLRKAIAKAEGK